MQPNLRELYQQVIIDHSKHPRNFCKCEHANHMHEGHNPLCGDRLTIYVDARDNKIVDICFQGQGCAISMASASLMTEAAKGKTIPEFLKLCATFVDFIVGENTAGADGDVGDGKAEAALYSSQTGFQDVAQIDSSSLALQRGAPAASERSIFGICEHREQGCNKAANQNAKSILDKFGKLGVLAGVREFPMRVKCATLPWHTLKAALLDKYSASVTTES